MAREATDGLVALKTLKKYKVATGDHDIRGWDVVTSDHRKVGSIDDLIVDREALRVRYAIIRVDHRILETKADSHILLPIAGAALDPDDKRVYLEAVDSEKLLAIPPYDHRRITRDYERVVRDQFRWGAGGERAERPDFYDHPAFEEGRLYQQRHDETPVRGIDEVEAPGRPVGSDLSDTSPRVRAVRDDRPIEEDIDRKPTR